MRSILGLEVKLSGRGTSGSGSRWRAAGLVWPSLATAAAFLVLVSLGLWQLQRKTWKDGLQRDIQARAKAEPGPLYRSAGQPSAPVFPEYVRVRVTGTFEHSRERHLMAVDSRLGPGIHVITPLQLTDGLRVLVNRGFVPSALVRPEKRMEGQVEGPVTITGLFRYPERRATFTPANNPVRNEWLWRDWQAMAGCPAAVPAAVCTDEASWTDRAKAGVGDRFEGWYWGFVDAEAEPANPGGWPKGGVTRLELNNRHMEYAFTWLGIAGALIGVFIAFARGRLQALSRSG